MSHRVLPILLISLCCVRTATTGEVPDFHISREIRKTRGGEPLPFARAAECLSHVRSLAATPAEYPDAARYDRILVSREIPPQSAELACLPAGGKVPVWTSGVLTEPVVGVLWLGERLLVWSDRQVGLLNARDGATVWVNEAVARPVANARGRSQDAAIIDVRYTSTRILLVTSDHRVVAANRDNGRVVWSTDVAPRSVKQLLSGERFVVLRLENDSTSDFLVLDSKSGEPLDKSAAGLRARNTINAAMAADGVLIWTGPVTITAADLGGATPRLLWEDKPRFPHGGFHGFDAPGQLIIVGERVYAVYATGNSATVRRFGVEKAAPSCAVLSWPLRPGAHPGAEEVANVTGSNPRLRVVPPDRLLIVSVGGITSVSLSHWRDQWTGIEPVDPSMDTFRIAPGGVLVGTDYVVLGAQLEERHRPPKPILAAYTRETSGTRNGDESGRLDHLYEVPLATGTVVRQWAGVEGGIYYLASDGVLYFMGGTRP